MSKYWWLFFIATILSVWNAGIVWFTQVAVYPLWPFVGADKFHDYHLTWWHDMWPSFGPVLLMFACSIALLWIRRRNIPVWSLWLGVLLQAAHAHGILLGANSGHDGHTGRHVTGKVSGIDGHTLVSGSFLSCLRDSDDLEL